MLLVPVGHTRGLARQADVERVERGIRNCEKDRRRAGEMFLDPKAAQGNVSVQLRQECDGASIPPNGLAGPGRDKRNKYPWNVEVFEVWRVEEEAPSMIVTLLPPLRANRFHLTPISAKPLDLNSNLYFCPSLRLIRPSSILLRSPLLPVSACLTSL